MKRQLIRVQEILERDYATDVDGAIILFHRIQEYLDMHIQVTLDFAELEEVSEEFLEQLLMLLYESYSSNFVSQHLRHKNLCQVLKDYVKDAVEGLTDLYKSTDHYQTLYPYLNKRVSTPDGKGKLIQVFQDQIAVILDKTFPDKFGNQVQKASYFSDSRDIIPLEGR